MDPPEVPVPGEVDLAAHLGLEVLIACNILHDYTTPPNVWTAPYKNSHIFVNQGCHKGGRGWPQTLGRESFC